jgi:glycolate oxidase FAD binding subunit
MSVPADTALARLESVAGAEAFRADDAARAGCAVDGVTPACVVAPASAEAVAEIVGLCAAEKLAVIPLGAGTKRGIGMPPARYDVALRLTRLDRVLDYDPGDLTLGVEPGIGIAKLAEILAQHSQFLPLAVPYANRATLGGTLSSGVDSPLRQAYGAARDFVLGMEFVTGEGKRAKSGGRVVKNVTGYDIHKLLVGALGTLGVITRINFRTFPLPAATRGFLAEFADAAGALELRRRIADSPLEPLTLDILSPQVAQLFARATPPPPEPQLFGPGPAGGALPLPGPWFPTAGWLVTAGFGGTEKVLERYGSELERMAGEAGARSAQVLGDEDRPKVWGRLREAIPLLLAHSPATTILRMSVLPSRFAEAIAAVERFSTEAKLPAAVIVRAVGVVYAAFTPEADDLATLGRVACSIAGLQNTAAELGGTSVAPFAPLDFKKRLSIWGPPRGDAELMRRVKAVFDPPGILAPGRHAGGV